MNNTMKKSLAGFLILGQVLLPVPKAEAKITPQIPEEVKTEFEKYCAKAIEEVKAKALNETSNTVAAACSKAEIWRQAYDGEKNKFITFGIAGSTLAASALTQFTTKNVAMRISNATAKTAATTASTAEATIPAAVATACGSKALNAIPIVGTAMSTTVGQIAAGEAVAAAKTADTAAQTANKALGSVEKAEKLIKALGISCKVVSGVAIVAKAAWDYSALNELNKTREDFELARDDTGYSLIFGNAMQSALVGVTGEIDIKSMMSSGTQSVEASFEGYQKTAEQSMQATATNMAALSAESTANSALLTAAQATQVSGSADPESCSKAILSQTAATTATTAANAASLAITAAIKASQGAKACMTNSLAIGMMAKTSYDEALKAIQLMKDEVTAAKDALEASQKSVTGFANTNLQQQNLSNNAMNNAMNSSGSASEGCSVNPGSLDCLSQNDALTSAITNSPEFMNEIAKNHGGKSLGQLVNSMKNSKLEDLPNQLANASSNPGLSKSLMTGSKNILNDPKYAGKFKFNGFVGPNRKIASKSDDEFDMSKFMNGMMGKLNPEDKKGEAKNDTDYVFRQLELMTPVQIQENKAISLFTRVAYRYRKKNGDLEQMTSTRMLDREVSSQKK